jgi:hypothetical protein
MGQTITVEVAPNIASNDDVVELGVKVGETAQSWLERLKERNAAKSAAPLTPQGAGRS